MARIALKIHDTQRGQVKRAAAARSSTTGDIFVGSFRGKLENSTIFAQPEEKLL